MKAIVCTRYGPPEVLQIREVPRPAPKKGQVCIRIHATAVTASDCIVRSLRLSPMRKAVARLILGITAPRQPILGLVLAGEVDSVGRGVGSFKPGDQVFGFGEFHFGAYAEYVCWPQGALLAARPRNLTFEEAAAIPYGGLLAAHFLRKSRVASGDRILIYGASGAIGTAAVQLARHLGAEVTGVCSSANLELVRSLGAGLVIDYTREDFVSRPERYDVIFDAVGRRKSAGAMRHSARVLSPNGRSISVDDGSSKSRPQDLDLLRRLAEEGVMTPVIDRRYALDQMVEAHRYVDQGHKKGNVIATVA
jgi:NADPH:quinone reductase-like Zn-dependent oxidoreductase